MRRRMLIIVALLIFVIAGVVFIGSQYLPSLLSGKSGSATATPAITQINIVFVAQDIPAGTIITEEYLLVGPWPSNYQLEGLIRNKNDIIGKRARIDLKRGEPIFQSQVVQNGSEVSDTASAMALKIQPGMVAIAIPMNRLSGVAYAIGNGDHIMIIATIMIVSIDKTFQSELPNNMLLAGLNANGEITFIQVQSGRIFQESPLSDRLLATYYLPTEAQRPRMVSAIVVQNARVLNVGTIQKSVASPTQGAGTTTPSTAQTNPDILVIEVKPDEALAITYLIRLHADLTYALRSAGDTQVFDVDSMDLQTLLDTYDIQVPNSLDYGTSPRVDSPYIPVLGNDVVVQAR
jgi:Flp pilus assembly protein CpaB